MTGKEKDRKKLKIVKIKKGTSQTHAAGILKIKEYYEPLSAIKLENVDKILSYKYKLHLLKPT